MSSLRNGGFTITYGAGGGGSAGVSGGAGGGGIYGPSAIHGSSGQNYALTMEKVEAYDKFMRFLDLNPDIAERYAVHKTYEILKETHEQE